eukprot:8294282-Ditylum_brightwellii.AAC.1
MKSMFLCKRGRQDVNPGVGFLLTRVKEATEEDLKKLLKMMGFLLYTINVFAVHPDMKSCKGATFALGKGVISSDSTKQK